MNSFYMVDGFLKVSELDNYEKGCDPSNSMVSDFNVQFKAATQSEVINKIKEFLGVEEDCIDRNACEDVGRIDIQVTENVMGEQATEAQHQQFKEGTIELWLATYTGHMLHVQEVEVENVANPQPNPASHYPQTVFAVPTV